MHSELNYPQVSLVYYMIHLNLLTIKSCSVIHVWWFNFSFQCIFFFLAVLFELNRVTTSQAKQYLIICRDKFMKSQIEPGTGTRSLIQVSSLSDTRQLLVPVYQCRFIYHLYYLFNDVKQKQKTYSNYIDCAFVRHTSTQRSSILYIFI